MIDITTEDLKAKLDAKKSVFLKIWKPGCGACKLSVPAVERVEQEFSGYEFCQIDSNQHPEILEISESDVLPTFFLFKDGNQTGKLIGFKGIEKLRSLF
jgi:thioredoxin-like negative regulator of GroEL